MAKITAIKQQQKRTERFSVFVDDVYEFSLSADQLVEYGLHSKMELSSQDIAEYKQKSNDGKLRAAVIAKLARRSHSRREIEQFLERKEAGKEVTAQICDDFEAKRLINDHTFTETWVRDRRLLKSRSDRELKQELRNKGISDSIVSEVLNQPDAEPEEDVLKRLVLSKRRQTRYQNDEKLIAYLSRKGFSYSLIRKVIDSIED